MVELEDFRELAGKKKERKKRDWYSSTDRSPSTSIDTLAAFSDTTPPLHLIVMGVS